ncbi:MAG: peptide chain release factor N(5)-glutamine methyltransferase [Brachymonas sp.]
MSTIAALLQSAIAQGLPRKEAQYLMLHVCDRETHDRAWLLMHETDSLQEAQLDRWQIAVQRRLGGEPVAYILGFKEFYGLRLMVDRRVLDPRDDTETLVEWALELIPANADWQVLDLGTGSGAIALAVKSQRPQLHMTATDASAEALAVARLNAEQLNLPVQFAPSDAAQLDWFASLGGHRFDVILSNPPYIAQGDAHLAALQHEPALALTSGADGLDAIRRIVAHAPPHLKPGGWLLLEHGYDQARQVRDLLAAQGFTQATTRQDLSGMERCTGALWPA